MDLCFKSDNGYGGILIRSLLRIEGKEQSVVTGPWDCCYALINYMGGSENVFPKLTYGEEKDTQSSWKQQYGIMFLWEVL